MRNEFSLPKSELMNCQNGDSLVRKEYVANRVATLQQYLFGGQRDRLEVWKDAPKVLSRQGGKQSVLRTSVSRRRSDGRRRSNGRHALLGHQSDASQTTIKTKIVRLGESVA